MRKALIACAITALLAGGGTAVASSLITGANVKNGSLTGADVQNGSLHGADLANGTVKLRDLSEGVGDMLKRSGTPGSNGHNGATGPAGAKGDSYLAGAYYSVAYYDKGDANSGAIATTACKAESDTAISGGVSSEANTPVSQSFPGRMNWDTNMPRDNRLDGWIIQFGGGSTAPGKVKVWALCVPNLKVPVEQTYTESSDG
jgi:hypothetical protein